MDFETVVKRRRMCREFLDRDVVKVLPAPTAVTVTGEKDLLQISA